MIQESIVGDRSSSFREPGPSFNIHYLSSSASRTVLEPGTELQAIHAENLVRTLEETLTLVEF